MIPFCRTLQPMAVKNPLPHVTDELLEYLSRLFPDRAPREDATDRQVWIDVGCQKVIRKLREIHDKTTERELTPDVQRR